MPHEIVIDGERVVLRDTLEVGRAADGPLLRLQRLANGDAVIMTAAAAAVDGEVLLGNLGVVSWGDGALVRVGGLRAAIVWRAMAERRVAAEGQHCRVCFGAFAADETATACPCEALFHNDCDRARLNCPACGRPLEGAVA